MNINEHIFREYDIRGIYPSDLNEDFAFLLGKAFGSIIKREGQTTTLVGYDNRFSSPSLYEALARGITSCGVNIINLGLVTTPMYYYGWTLLNQKSGIMVTASHNPKEYNGFKISLNGLYNAAGDDIQKIKQVMLNNDFVSGEGQITTKDLKQEYIDYILSSINLGSRKLKVVVDAGNGTATVVIKDILDKLNINYIPMYFESDPSFPNHHPDPSVSANLQDLAQKVIAESADVGFAYDGDADRIGLVDENGEIISIDHFMIIILRDIMNNLNDKRISFDVKCSKALEDEIIKLGGIPYISRTGNSYLRANIVKEGLEFGGELSGHICFNDKFLGYDDGIYASLRMMELLSKTTKKTSELLLGIEKYYNTEELKIAVSDDNKFKVVEEVIKYAKSKGYEVITIDGCKVIFEDGFALIRASNTTPNLTLRFESKNIDKLTLIQDEFMSEIKLSISEVEKFV